MEGRRYVGAAEAAGELGVSLQTLYSYVSRGMVRSEPGEGRGRRYRVEDVKRLLERSARRRDPGRVSGEALAWGEAVMESGITLLTDGGVFYRGRSVARLASERSVEEVAALLWRAEEVEGLFEGRSLPVPELPGGLSPFERFQAALPLAALRDPAAYDLRPASVARCGARLMRMMAALAAGGEEREDLARTLGSSWGLDETGERLVSAAMVLCADHELPVSTFAARCVASSGATPYAVVEAGLAALGGTRHGGVLDLVETFLEEVEASKDAGEVISRRLRRGDGVPDGVPGFGHRLYPEGDPRGRVLLRMLEERYPASPAVESSRSVVEEVEGLIGERPTLDLALVTLGRTLGLPGGAPLALFALGRTAGWVAHAIEQYNGGSLIRPRARYVGEPPETREQEPSFPTVPTAGL